MNDASLPLPAADRILDLESQVADLNQQVANLLTANTKLAQPHPRRDLAKEHQQMLDAKNRLIEKLETELASVREDAERYRWLRHTYSMLTLDALFHSRAHWSDPEVSRTQLDAAIDAARKDG